MAATVVVQCPTCETRFRIADDKVTDRGVRVRCTSCKNVFPVRRAGSEAEVPGPGQTMELSSLSAQQVAKATGTKPPSGPIRPPASKPPTGPVRSPAKPPTGPQRAAASRPPTGPVKPVTTPNRPKTGPVRPSRPPTGPIRPGDAAARKLDTDDLFGMDELTGDAPPSSTELDPPAPPPKPAAAKPSMDFGDLELDTDPAPPANNDAPAPAASAMESAADEEPLELAEPARTTGKVKTAPVLGADQAGPRPPTPRPPARRGTTGPIAASQAIPPPPPPPDLEAAPSRALVSSALTGLLGATLAIGVLVISAFNDDSAAGWLGLAPGNEVVATRVVSGLYDTAAGKPVFFVRGRIENHGKRAHGPVRVTAELVADGSVEAKADGLAGAEPSAEEVYSVRSPDDAAKLARALENAKVQRKLQPGESIPFFALIADPPADLVRHRLHLKVDPLDAWHPPTPAQASKEK